MQTEIFSFLLKFCANLICIILKMIPKYVDPLAFTGWTKIFFSKLKVLLWNIKKIHCYQNLPYIEKYFNRNIASSRPLQIYMRWDFISAFQITCSAKNISSYRRCFIEKGVLKFVKLIGKHLCWSLFFNNVTALQLATCTAQKMKFSRKYFFSKCDQIRRKLNEEVKCTEEIFNGNLHFLCSVD